MFCGPKFGMLKSGVAAGTWNGTLEGLTPAFVADILGSAEPNHMWWYGEASGATDLAGGKNLTDSGSPTKQVASTPLGSDTTLVPSNSSTQRMAHADAGDVGLGTIVIIHIYERITTGNFLDLFGKRTSVAGNAGYEYMLRTNGHSVYAAGTLTTKTLTNTTSHGINNAEVVLMKQSPTDAEFGVWTRLVNGSTTQATGTMTNIREFSVGDGFRNSDNCRHGMTLVWLGANGDGFNNTERSALAVALGYE